MQEVPESERVRILSPAGRARAAAALAPVPLSRRFLAGLPSALADLLMAAACLSAWIAPGSMPAGFVRTAALTMLIEFLCIHGTVVLPLLGWLASGRSGRLAWLAWPLAALPYLAFAVGASLALDSWWPTLFFAWLLLSRYLLPRWNLAGHDEHVDVGALWLVSLLLWLALAIGTAMLPVPEFGWDEVPAWYRLPGGGLWARETERLLAFAVLYFVGLAWFKLGARPQGGRELEGRA